jgi:hypothetical protein
MTVPYEINAAPHRIADQQSSETHTPADARGVKPGKSAVTPVVHQCVFL